MNHTYVCRFASRAQRIGPIRSIVTAAGLGMILLGGCPPSENGADDPNDTSDVVTANRPPVANAGDDQTVTAGDLVVLDGGASSDPDFDRLSFIWRQIDGPSVGTIQNAASTRPQFVAPNVATATTLVFRLTVADGLRTASDEVVITVQPR